MWGLGFEVWGLKFGVGEMRGEGREKGNGTEQTNLFSHWINGPV